MQIKKLSTIFSAPIHSVKLPNINIPREAESLFSAIILSTTIDLEDVYDKYLLLTSKNISKSIFLEFLNEMEGLDLIRLVNVESRVLLHLMPDSIVYALVKCMPVIRRNRSTIYQSLLYLEQFNQYTSFFFYFLDDAMFPKHLSDDFFDVFCSVSFSNLFWSLPFQEQTKAYFVALMPTVWIRTILLVGPKTVVQLFDELLIEESKLIGVDYTKDRWFFDEADPFNAVIDNTIGQHYLSAREEVLGQIGNASISMTHIIDLYCLKFLSPQKFEIQFRAFIQALKKLERVQPSALIQNLLIKLQWTNEDLVDNGINFNHWFISKEQQSVMWIYVLLDMLSLQRIKSTKQYASIIKKLTKNPFWQSQLNIPPKLKVEMLAKRVLAQSIQSKSKIEYTPFFDEFDSVTTWLDELEMNFLDQPSTQTPTERLVWILEDNQQQIILKHQKQSKKGWTPGRVIQIERIHYDLRANLTENDQLIVSCLLNAENWNGQHFLTSTLVRLLKDADNFYDSSGNKVSLVKLKKLMVFSSNKEKLVIKQYPTGIASKTVQSDAHHSLSLFTRSNKKLGERISLIKLTEQIYGYDESSQEFKSLVKAINNQSQIPVSFTERLIGLIDGKVDWYCAHLDRSSITIGEWDPHPHVWIKAESDILQITIEHQSVDGLCNVPSGTGDEWISGRGEVWYQRNIKQEASQSAKIVTSTGLQKDFASEKYQIPLKLAVNFFEALSNIENVRIHWHQSNKQIKIISPENLNIRITNENNWFTVSGEIKVEGDSVLELSELLKAKHSGFISVESENVLILIDQALKQKINLLDSVLNENLAIESKLAYPLQKLIDSMNVESDQGWDALATQWQKPVNLPDDFLQGLRSYQSQAVKWAVHLLDNGFGACLADDMGLGKTIQALKVIEFFADQGPSLVICPKSVVYNWQSEAQRFAPNLDVIMVDLVNIPEDKAKLIGEAKAGELLILGYNQATILQSYLLEKNWQTLVLDEAQQIKNPNTQRAKSLFALNAKGRMTLSGTPIENHLLELWSQFEFLNPGLLNTLSHFKQKYGKASKNQQELDRLRALVGPFIMRRLKKEVLVELPEKTEINHQIDLSSEERSVYEAIRQEALAKTSANSIELLASLTRLRQSCCDANLIFDHITTPSSKLSEALYLIQEVIESGRKVLVFSQFVKLLARLGRLLKDKKIKYSYLDGKSSLDKRKDEIEQFKSNKTDVFLISLKAGGAGLNLTEADTVIHLDPWWNPAVEDQASDRVHRIGQTQPVTIYRLIATDTIEEKIIKLHTEKRDLADKVLSGQSDDKTLNPALLLSLMSDE